MYKKIYKSPISNIILTSDGTNLTGLYFENSYDSKKHNPNYIDQDLEIFKETINWLDTYFKGKKPDFIPKYKLELTPFQKEVTEIMNKIPYGTTITYKDIAKEIAKKRGIKKMSAQAVGNAVGNNPICIIIPCHRVLGQNNNLTGYGGGIKNKIKLLEIEGNNIKEYKIPKKGNKLWKKDAVGAIKTMNYT